jgi:hypothetical protein
VNAAWPCKKQVNVPLPRGSVDLDVLAEETLEGIRSKVVCECKAITIAWNWQAIVKFRTNPVSSSHCRKKTELRAEPLAPPR